MPEIIIDDTNFHLFTNPDPSVHGRGLVPRDYTTHPHGSLPYAAAFDLPIIPRTEWDDRIKEMEATESRLSDVRKRHAIPSLDQNGTNYCWAHGPVSAMMLVRALNNQPYVRLSATAIAAQLKGFKNVGGWGGEALEFIAANGTPSIDFWKPNDINRKYVTAEMKTNAAEHKITEWYDLQPRNFDQVMTCLFLRIPVPVGYNWWSHEVCAIDPVKTGSNTYGARIWNSWGDSWSDNGMGILTESKATPDDAFAPRVITPSTN